MQSYGAHENCCSANVSDSSKEWPNEASDGYDDELGEEAYGSAFLSGKSTSETIDSDISASVPVMSSHRKYSQTNNTTLSTLSTASPVASENVDEIKTPEQLYRAKIEADREKVKKRMRELVRQEKERKEEATRRAQALATTITTTGTLEDPPVVPSHEVELPHP